MAKTLGIDLEAVEFPSRYGGNIRVFMGLDSEMNNHQSLNELDDRESLFEDQFEELKLNIEKWMVSKRSILKSTYDQHGKIRAKAFPGRAAILVKMLNIDENMISAVYEKPGSLKIGHYLPGTRIIIRSDDDFELLNNDAPVLNLAWHISNEINAYLVKNGHKAPVLDILSQEDFVS
jgi:hypothetical protein